MRRSVFVHIFFFSLAALLYSVNIQAYDEISFLPEESSTEIWDEHPLPAAPDESAPPDTLPKESLTEVPAKESPAGIPIDAVLVIDVSGSMKMTDPDYLSRSAALTFIDSLSNSEGSRAGLVTFSDTLQKVIPLTRLDVSSEDNDLIRELNSLNYTSGDTDIGTAMETAVSMLNENNGRTSQKSIFLLTDGEIDLPRAEDEEKAEKESLTRALVAVEEAKAERIAIHTVALDLSGSTDEKLMSYMADSTGGTANRVTEASMLGDVFRTLSSYTERQAVEAAAMAAETEPAESLPETETEPETESETEYIPAVTVSGTIDGPVHLKGLLPNMCRASLRLSNLFSIEGNGAGAVNSIRYTAYSDDNDILKCTLEGDELCISGLKNGTAGVEIIAEPDIPSYSSTGAANMSFSVQIDAVIPSVYYLGLIPAAAALIAVTVILIRRRDDTRQQMTGSLQWYVRSEHEKIFGMPSQTMADLEDYGSRVRLSELIHDDLLPESVLGKVTIRAIEGGIRISSRSSSALIGESSSDPGRSLDMTGSGRFRVFCDDGSRRAVIIAMYTALSGYGKEPSYEDDSDERTRLLV